MGWNDQTHTISVTVNCDGTQRGRELVRKKVSEENLTSMITILSPL